MSPYKEASSKGVPFCWCCTKTELLAECGIKRQSRWKLKVFKYKYQLLQEKLDSMKKLCYPK
jgi:hypothetical protein